MIKFYNTLTRKKEEFIPLTDNEVGMYACGPTVYNFAHVGNLRAYLFEDILKRVLLYNNYEVNHIMNITDVGHLTGDGDMGEDKLETGSRREGKTAFEIADFYTEAFKKDIGALNILNPNIFCKATDNISEQIEMIKTLQQKGFTYKTSDGIYFDTAKVSDYNKLSHMPLEEMREGARVEKNPEKNNPTDFALWKFSPSAISGQAPRQMEWPSPWGVGFPGWHIECSAMSVKYLGDQFDIHCGGIDHINIHHTNELAQTEASTGKKPWVRFWMHNAFLNIAGGKKMAKTGENFLTLDNAVIKKGIDPLALRYATLSVHYRKPMEWSDNAIESAKNSLAHLYNQVQNLSNFSLSSIKHTKKIRKIDKKFKEEFLEAINDDLNTPRALAVLQELLKSPSLTKSDKLTTALDFDKVLGLKLESMIKINASDSLPENIKKLISTRQIAREEKKWKEADEIRKQIESEGYMVEDTINGQSVKKKI